MDNFKLWHTLSAEETAQKLDTKSRRGLTHAEAGKRYLKDGISSTGRPWHLQY
jgi:hypothetical protein